MKLVRKNLLLLALLPMLTAPVPLLACAACYGKSDSPLASAMDYGIFTLLGVVLCVLAVFLVGLVHLVRKGEAMHKDAVKRMEDL